MADAILTQEQLKSKLIYDKDNGIFTRVSNGKKAGSLHKTGYVRIKITSKHSYLAHRLAWLYVTGNMPLNCIDHINGIKDDNRFSNLRDVTNAQNCQNRHNQSKVKKLTSSGVSYNETTKKYYSVLTKNYKKTYLGSYPTPELAHEAYVQAKRQLHECCTI